ncbi:ferredoxin [Nocardia sp. NPDC059246]|uniref:ferredoxin n=1 Tax=unclassified Nocardia TaxID=2637762 RepID=UPI0036836888
MTVHIEIDEDACVGGGQCVLATPQVFDQRDEDGVAILLNEAPGPELHESVRESAMRVDRRGVYLNRNPGGQWPFRRRRTDRRLSRFEENL